MRAKVNRLCARTKTGKLQVSEEIHRMWLQKGRVRDDLIQLMATANGKREAKLAHMASFGPALW